ncbi:MAG: hypothetical protein ACKO96_38590 [Flammeovirgaceae bacterium]
MKMYTNLLNYRLSLNQDVFHGDGDVEEEDWEDVEAVDGDNQLDGDVEDTDVADSGDFIYFKP